MGLLNDNSRLHAYDTRMRCYEAFPEGKRAVVNASYAFMRTQHNTQHIACILTYSHVKIRRRNVDLMVIVAILKYAGLVCEDSLSAASTKTSHLWRPFVNLNRGNGLIQ